MQNLVTYSGRFQPFGSHHYSVYKYLVKEFRFCPETYNIFITTSNKIEYPNSPFNFEEKKKIITTMFTIPQHKVIKVKRPYDPIEIKSNYDDEDTRLFIVVSEKDADRLVHSKYYIKAPNNYKECVLKPMKEHGYVIVAPEFKLKIENVNISGTELRKAFAFERFKKKLFENVYGRFDEDVFKLITSRVSFMKLMKEGLL